MAQAKGEELLKEMNQLLRDGTQQKTAAQADDDSTLPFETLDEYGTDPVLFSEMSLKMLNRVEDIFDLAVKYNRRSSQYLKSCAQLDRGIRYLASSCLTKIALEERKKSFPELSQLTTEKLYRMASVHFRKIDKALSEYKKENQKLDDALLDMQFRYFNLLQRLRSTEVRIGKYKLDLMCGNEQYDVANHGLAFNKPKSPCDFSHKQDDPSAFRRASAFSELKEFSVSGPGTADQNSSGNQLPEPHQETASTQKLLNSPDTHQEAALQPDSPNMSSAHQESAISPVSRNDPSSGQGTAFTPELLNSPAVCPDEPDLPEDLSALFDPNNIRWIEILRRAAARNDENPDTPEGQSSFIFTKEEMQELLDDYRFCIIYPDMAADLRQALQQFEDSG